MFFILTRRPLPAGVAVRSVPALARVRRRRKLKSTTYAVYVGSIDGNLAGAEGASAPAGAVPSAPESPSPAPAKED